MYDKLIGNERAKDVLRRMIRARRVPGALLFVGEDGVGKKRFAIELAKAINCRRPTTGGEACDACASCARVAAFAETNADDKQVVWSQHPDVGLLRPPGRTITVQQIRELERESNFRPYEGAARFFVVEEADRLGEAAANALLKTLEEPHATAHIVLLTSRPAGVLPTIRSRCQIVRFTPLDREQIERHLLATRRFSPADAALVARLARGSLGRALTFDLKNYLEQRSLATDILNAIVRDQDRSRLLRLSEYLSDPKHKDEYEARLETIELVVRDLWTLALDGRTNLLVNEDMRRELIALAARTDSRRAADWMRRIEETRRGLNVNVNRKIAADALLLAMDGGR